MTYYKTCSDHIATTEGPDARFVCGNCGGCGHVPVAEGAIIEINDMAVQNGARYLEVQFPEFAKTTARELVRGVLRAAAEGGP